MNAPLSRRARVLGILLLAAVFAAGSLAGAASTRVLSARETTPAGGKSGDCEDGKHRGKRMLYDQIDLTPDQRTRIEAIMARGRARTDSLWRRDGTRVRAAVDSTRAEIRAVMTPPQRARFDQLRAERDARKRERHKGADGPPKHGR
ncbi:MAG TPA: hypothetical protein VNP72_08900 [Longimicrobium sp.]|nr:hypothetical protein [Longimicrobium sp.]